MLPPEWLGAFVPVGLMQGVSWTAAGAGVLIAKPPFVWLVTANHVVNDLGETTLAALVTKKSGVGVYSVGIGFLVRQAGLAWVRNAEADLAAAPMPLSPDYKVTAIGEGYFLRMAELVPSMPCFTIGCPYGLHNVNPETASPLVLDGIISGVNPVARKVYTSAPTFRGNSGGPLIAIRSPFSADGTMTVGRATVTLAGVMLSVATIQGADGSGTELRLGVAAPIDDVLTLLDSPYARSITERLTALPPAAS